MDIISVICHKVIRSMWGLNFNFKIRWRNLTSEKKSWAQHVLHPDLLAIAKGERSIGDFELFRMSTNNAILMHRINRYSIQDYVNFISLFHTNSAFYESWCESTNVDRSIKGCYYLGDLSIIWGNPRHQKSWTFMLELLRIYCNRVDTIRVPFIYYVNHLEQFCTNGTFCQSFWNFFRTTQYVNNFKQIALDIIQQIGTESFRSSCGTPKLRVGIPIGKLTIF